MMIKSLCKNSGALVLVAACGILAAPTPAVAERANPTAGGGTSYSVGLGLGDPTGIEFGFWFDNRNWFDIGLGAGGFSSAVLYATYHWMLADFDVGNSDVVQLGLSLGLGGLVGGGGNRYWGGRRGAWGGNYGVRFGARVPFGLEFLFSKVPLSLFFQIGPQVTNFFPDDLVTGQIGARFHFGGN